MSKNTLSLLFALLCCSFLSAQDTLVLHFQDSLLSDRSADYIFPTRVYHVGRRGWIHPGRAARDIRWNNATQLTRHLGHLPRHLRLPDSLKGDTALGYFTAYTHISAQSQIRHTMVVVVRGNGTRHPVLFADRNANLDLRDDGPGQPVVDSMAVVSLTSPSLPHGKTAIHCWLGNPYAIWQAQDQDSIEQAGMLPRRRLWGPHPDRPFPLAQSLSVLYGNTRALDTTIGGVSIRLRLQDGDCSGHFYDHLKGKNPDLLQVPNPVVGHYVRQAGAQEVAPVAGSVVNLPAGNMRVVAVAPTGDWVKLVFTDQRPKILLKGDTLPEIFLESLMDGAKIPLNRLRDTSRYTLIDVWGPWCGPCHRATPDLRRLDSLYRVHLKIIGIPTFAPNPQLLPYLRENRITWDQYRLDYKEQQQLLQIEAWPTYILLAPDGTVVFPRGGLPQIEALMKTLPAKPVALP